jgi:hypothetical protein
MGSRRVVNGNTTILPNCGGTNGAGCNQDLIVEDDGEVILEPPNNLFYPFWAASVLTDRGYYRPTSVTMDNFNNVYTVDMIENSAPPPLPNKRIIRKISYTPSTSTIIAPTGNISIDNWYQYTDFLTPGTAVYLNGIIFTYDYYPTTGLLYLIGIPISGGSGQTINSPGILIYNNTGTPNSPPSGTNIVRGSTLTTDGTYIYYLKDPNTSNQPFFRIDPSNILNNGTAVTGNIPTGTNPSSLSISGMRVYNPGSGPTILFAHRNDYKVYSVAITTFPAPNPVIFTVAGNGLTTTPVPAFPSPSGLLPPPIQASISQFEPRDIEIVITDIGPKMYIADFKFNRVLIMDLISTTNAALNKVRLFAGYDGVGNFVNDPATVSIPPPPAYVLALGETPPPPTNAPPYTLVAANACNLVQPICLFKVPSAPTVSIQGPTQILVGTDNTYNGGPALTHLPLMLLKYYY